MGRMMSNFSYLVSQKEVKEKRDRRYRQLEIAEEAGVSQSVVSKWLNNDNIENTTLATAHKLAAWLGVSIDDLFKVEA